MLRLDLNLGTTFMLQALMDGFYLPPLLLVGCYHFISRLSAHALSLAMSPSCVLVCSAFVYLFLCFNSSNDLNDIQMHTPFVQ